MALLLGLAPAGCRHRPPQAEEGTGVSARSYPILAHHYHTTLTARTTPDELIHYLFADLSWTREMSGALEVRIPGDVSVVDMTRPGQDLDFKIRLLGVEFPCRMITLKYVPEREIWLMIVTRGAWILWRVHADPAAEGCLINAEMVGQTTPGLNSLLDAFKLVKAGSVRFDRMLAMVQAHFDPGFDPDAATARGLRGELYDSYFQGYEASVSLDAAPRDLAARIYTGDRLAGLIPLLGLDQGCNPGRLRLRPRETVYCRATWRPDGPALPAAALCGTGLDSKEGRARNVWIVVGGILMQVQARVLPEGSGSRLRLVVSTELPGQDNASVMELMDGIASIPGTMERELTAVGSAAPVGAGKNQRGAGEKE